VRDVLLVWHPRISAMMQRKWRPRPPSIAEASNITCKAGIHVRDKAEIEPPPLTELWLRLCAALAANYSFPGNPS